MTTSRSLTFYVVSLGLLLLPACAPKIYVIDRPTLMEEESGGDWPDLQQNISARMLKKSPAALKTDESSEVQKKLTRNLSPDESLNKGR